MISVNRKGEITDNKEALAEKLLPIVKQIGIHGDKDGLMITIIGRPTSGYPEIAWARRRTTAVRALLQEILKEKNMAPIPRNKFELIHDLAKQDGGVRVEIELKDQCSNSGSTEGSD
ncbi:MAG: hypothetical protein AAGC55_25675 [Myxococcota bacterium]